MNTKTMLSSAAALAALAVTSPAIVTPFANDGAPAASTKAKREKAPAPVIAAPRADLPIPVIVRAAPGSKSPFPFDTLEVGGSFGVVNKTAKQMSSIVSNVNRKETNFRDAKDANGNVIMEAVKDANGAEIPGMTKPKREQIKIFVLAEVDAKKDPDKAKVRVWRKQ